MYIMDDGIRLNAKLDMPTNGDRICPLVIVIHGFTGNMEERHIVAVSRMLNEIGFATLRVDMFGHGGSDGRFEDHTLYKWMSNAMTVIDYARDLDFVTDLYLCGHSQGGLTAILTAALKHDLIKGVIPLSPACMVPEQTRKGIWFGPYDPEKVPDEIRIWGDRPLKGNYIRVAQTIHVEEAVDRYKGPVLIVQGDQDEPSLMRSAVEAAHRYNDCKLVMIPGDTHCYDHHLDQMLNAVKDWMTIQRDQAREAFIASFRDEVHEFGVKLDPLSLRYQWGEPDVNEQVVSLIEKQYPAESRKGEIIFYGPSNITFWYSLEEDMKPYKAQNHGMGGCIDEDMIHYAPRLLYPYAPKAVFFQTGSNDLASGIPVEAILENKRRMYSLFLSNMQGTKLVVCSGLPLPGRMQYWEMTEQTNELLRKMCRETEGMYFLDATDAMLSDIGERKYRTADGRYFRPEYFRMDRIHLNKRGHDVWTALMKAKLEEIFG